MKIFLCLVIYIVLLSLMVGLFCTKANSIFCKIVFLVLLFSIGVSGGFVVSKNTTSEKASIEAEKLNNKVREYAVSKNLIDVAVKELKMDRNEVKNILWRCAATETDLDYAFQLLDPTLTEKEIQRLVDKLQ